MTSPKGPSKQVRDFAGKGLFMGQYARFEPLAVFRMLFRELRILEQHLTIIPRLAAVL